MFRRCLFMNLIFLLIFGVSSASALPQESDQEVLLGGSFFRPIGSGGGTFNMDARYGYFLSDEFQVGLRQSYTLNHNDDDPDTWNAVTSPYGIYHFYMDNGSGGRSPLVPYAGAFLGAVWNDDDLTGTVGPQAGVKYYLTDSTFLNAEYRYEWFFEEFRDANEVQDANHVALLGIGYNW